MTMAGKCLSALVAGLLFGTMGLAAPAPTSRPISAKVLKVEGKAQYAVIGTGSWTLAKAGDILNEGMEIRTPIRGSLLVQLHDTTLVQVMSATRVSLNELTRTTGQEKTRIFLHRGTVRAGIAEGPLHSDFQIACPAAVLSREGTWGIEISYDPATGAFFVALDTEGLIRVLNLRTGRQRILTPGQFVTQAMQRWIQTALFQRTVSFADPFGTTRVEQVFYANNSGGRTVINPTGSGATQVTPSVNTAFNQQQQIQNQISNALITEQIIQRIFFPPAPRTYEYRFGNFGTGIPESTTGSPAKTRLLRR